MDYVSYIFHLVFVDPTTNLLVVLARIFGGNYGIAIIVFTLLMKVITWPLTMSQFRQSRVMQAIQPRMQEIQKKYKGKDPKKLQAEQMALYKEAGVNPLGCIFPMLAQMPIWIALYQSIRLTLGDAPEGLITLSQRLYPIPFVHSAVPLSNQLLFWNLGQPDSSYLLVFVVMASMYVQQKMMTPRPTVAAITPQAQQQQQTTQMMSWMMPLMFGFISLNVPAGLALYWAVSNLSGVILQYLFMGRTFDWKYMLSLSPGPPAPGAQSSKARAEGRPARLDRPKDESAEQTPGDGGVARPKRGKKRR